MHPGVHGVGRGSPRRAVVSASGNARTKKQLDIFVKYRLSSWLGVSEFLHHVNQQGGIRRLCPSSDVPGVAIRRPAVARLVGLRLEFSRRAGRS